jgi:hypothetical protein
MVFMKLRKNISIHKKLKFVNTFLEGEKREWEERSYPLPQRLNKD